jgi:hypothetical protein
MYNQPRAWRAPGPRWGLEPSGASEKAFVRSEIRENDVCGGELVAIRVHEPGGKGA